MFKFLSLFLLLASAVSHAAEFQHIGDYLLRSEVKITSGKAVEILTKPLLFHLESDGLQVKLSTAETKETIAIFEIYQTNGLRTSSQKNAPRIASEAQALSQSGPVVRQLCFSAESFTLTIFPGAGDRTTVCHAVAVEKKH